MTVSSLSYYFPLLLKKGPVYMVQAASAVLYNSAKHYLHQNQYLSELEHLPARLTPQQSIEFAQNKCAQVFQPMQVKSELLSFLKLVEKKQPKTIVEIGTANGGTLFCLTKTAPTDAHIISIDLPGGIHGGGYAEFQGKLYQNFTRSPQKMDLLRADSHSPLTKAKLKKLLRGKEIDLLFIDGDHTYDGVRADFLLYAPLVKKGGLVVFHDIVPHSSELNCQVNLFWERIKTKFSHQEFVENWQQGVCGIGVLKIS